MLRSRLLSQSPTLTRASTSGPSVRRGERGEAIQRLQLSLLSLGMRLPRSTGDQSRAPDGIFGAETEAAVRQFQTRNRLVVDGIVGKQTLAALDGQLPHPASQPRRCSNCSPGNETRSRSLFTGANFRGVTATPTAAFVGGVSLPSGLRFLTAAQRTVASSVFGTSLDYARIVLSDATGMGGRPFTIAVPFAGLHVVVINAGTFSPSRDLLIHELAHAWQSQHAVDPKKFMWNSVQSQVLADELLSRLGVDASSYYYEPGRNFALYGAEQIACQVESGVPSILSVIRSLPPHVPHPLNELSLAVPRWEARAPGIVTSC